MGFQLHSDFIGPLPSTAVWILNLFQPGPNESRMGNYQLASQFNPNDNAVYVDASSGTWHGNGTGSVQNGQSVGWTVDLFNQLGGTVIDHGSGTLTWDGSSMLGSQVLQQQTTVTGGGLTDTQAQQLTNVERATALHQVLDALTLTEVTSGPTPDFVGANLVDTVFGVLIRLANIPPELQPITPDGDYWLPTLATVRIYRGSDLWIRAPIHTSSKIVSLEKEGLTVWATALTVTQWALQMTLQVNFLEGVTGQVFLMRFP